jgi:hypothetical protein
MRDVVIDTQRPIPLRAPRIQPIFRARPASRDEAPRPDSKVPRKAIPGLGYGSLGKARITS